MTEFRRRHRLLYVTDLERQLSGGGSYAVNWHAASELEKRFGVSYAGPLVPRPGLLEKTISKARRHLLHRTGRFTYFSPSTLDQNARMVEEKMAGSFDGVVFRSSTRWCRSRPTVPYFVYLDAVFHTFFHNTFDPQSFDNSDLQRIWDEEARFLEKSAAVLFESEWALAKARDAYQLRGEHYFAPGRGGVIEPPVADTWSPGTHALVSVSMNFRQKGGDILLEAYKSLKPRFPSLAWHIVGAPPDGDWRSEGIVHEGVLDPGSTEGRARYVRVLSDAFAIVHPTREDTSPLVLTEAAYFGCPAVSVNHFAIPELVIDGATGILVDFPPEASEVAAGIARLLEDENAYAAMRRETRRRALEKYSWDAVGTFICDRIAESLGS